MVTSAIKSLGTQGMRRTPPLTLEYLTTIRTLSEILVRSMGGKVEDLVTRILYGVQAGLPEMAAARWVTVINGQPSIWGDAIPGLIFASGLCEFFAETMEESGDDRHAICAIRRSGDTTKTFTFSVKDAKKAGLWGKKGPWSQYPDRMLQLRARNLACRNVFPDVLCGLTMAEESDDVPTHDTSIHVLGITETVEPTLKQAISQSFDNVTEVIDQPPADSSPGSYQPEGETVIVQDQSKATQSQVELLTTLRDQYYLVCPNMPKTKTERSKWWKDFVFREHRVESAKHLTVNECEQLILKLKQMVEEKSPF